MCASVDISLTLSLPSVGLDFIAFEIFLLKLPYVSFTIGTWFLFPIISVDFYLSFLIGPHRHRSTDAYHGTNGDAKC